MKQGDIVRIHVDYDPHHVPSWFQDRVGTFAGYNRFAGQSHGIVDVIIDGRCATVNTRWLSSASPCPMEAMV